MSDTVTIPVQAIRNLIASARYNAEQAKADVVNHPSADTFHRGYQTGRITTLESHAETLELLLTLAQVPSFADLQAPAE